MLKRKKRKDRERERKKNSKQNKTKQNNQLYDRNGNMGCCCFSINWPLSAYFFYIFLSYFLIIFLCICFGYFYRHQSMSLHPSVLIFFCVEAWFCLCFLYSMQFSCSEGRSPARSCPFLCDGIRNWTLDEWINCL